jgi:hypothetical protein
MNRRLVAARGDDQTPRSSRRRARRSSAADSGAIAWRFPADSEIPASCADSAAVVIPMKPPVADSR